MEARDAYSTDYGDIIAKRKLAGNIMEPVTFILCLLFLVLVLGRSILRQQPMKWMQILATVGMMGFVTWKIVLVVMGKPGHGAKLWPTLGHCQTAIIFLYWFLLLANAGMNLVTFERIGALLRSTKHSEAGCPVPIAAAALCLASLGTFAISAGLTLGAGGLYLYVRTHSGVAYHSCLSRDERYPYLFYWTSLAQNMLTTLLTLILLATYVVKRVTSQKPLKTEPDEVIPIIVANVVFVVGAVCDAVFVADLKVIEPYFVAYPVVLLIWLFAEGEVRRAFKPVCCACCSSGNDEERVGLLGHH